MSWAEEQAIDIGPPNRFGEFFPTRESSNIWATKDGRRLKISEMTDEHLYNAYKKFNAETLAREILLRLFKKEVEK